MPAAENRIVKNTPIQWFGGKWEMSPWIASILPEASIFVITHGGAGSPLWHVEPYPVEVYNDIDSMLVNFFRVCRENPEELARSIELTPYSREEYETCKKLIADNPVELARQFAYVGRSSFSGAWGRSWSYSAGHTSRGMSSAVSRYLHLPETIREVAQRMITVQIENLDAVKLIEKYDKPETLFYLDPPYLASTRNGSEVYRHEMGDEETTELEAHEKLVDTLKQCRGMWALSGYRSELYDSLLSGFNRIDRVVPCRSNITNRGASSRPTRTECLWTNYDIPPAQSEAA